MRRKCSNEVKRDATQLVLIRVGQTNCHQRVPKLFAELALARGDGRYARILRGLTGVQLLILDDWGLEPLDAGARRDLYLASKACPASNTAA